MHTPALSTIPGEATSIVMGNNQNMQTELEGLNNRNFGLLEEFRKEHFKVLIQNTYDQWWHKREGSWSMKEYMEVVEKGDFVTLYGRHLKGGNLLDMESLPFLDLGDRPGFYQKNTNSNTSESF